MTHNPSKTTGGKGLFMAALTSMTSLASLSACGVAERNINSLSNKINNQLEKTYSSLVDTTGTGDGNPANADIGDVEAINGIRTGGTSTGFINTGDISVSSRSISDSIKSPDVKGPTTITPRTLSTLAKNAEDKADKTGDNTGKDTSIPPLFDPCNTINCEDSNWVTSFDTPLPTEPTTGTLRNEFLQFGEDGIDTGTLYNGGLDKPTVATLSLNALDNATATGSVSFFRGFASATDYKYYAGISSDTSVGAPLPEPTDSVQTTAIWPGQIQSYRYNVLKPAQAFDLMVDFGGRKIGAFVQYAQGSNAHFKLDGVFDKDGIIDGTAVYGSFADNDPSQPQKDSYYTPGILTGVIGRDGAVGAFISNNDGIGSRPFAGGFVASSK